MTKLDAEIVQFDNVGLRYGAEREVLTDVSFTLYPGCFYFLTGASGAGKTSLLKLIAGLDQPTSGEVTVRGRVQMVFQDPQGSLNPRLKIWKSIAEAMPGRLPKSEQRERAAAALEEVGMSGKALDRYPHEFSGGQRQRISIARALSFNGLANAFALAGINAGRHVGPLFAGDTVYAWSEVLETAELPGRTDVGALRLRTVATKNQPCGNHPDKVGDAYDPSVILDLDYWAFVPR